MGDIYGTCMPKFELACIHNTTNPLHNNLVKLCPDVQYKSWGDQ